MKCCDIMELLDRLAPACLACGWDNPGLLAGRSRKEVRKLLLTVDVDDETVKRAIEGGADMIISHHPLIFKAIKRVTDEDFIGRRLVSMLQADICCCAMHTNYDAAPGCMADIAAGRLGIAGGRPLEETGEENGAVAGIGKVGELAEPVCGPELAVRVREAFHLPRVLVYGEELYKKEPVTTAAVCPGSGGSVIEAAIKAGAQALVTGDISHHEGIDAAARGLMIIDAGHYGLEHVFMDHVEGWLAGQLPAGVEIEKMPVRFPTAVV